MPLTKWRPRRWEAMHEEIVLLSCIGKSNAEIAAQFKYTPQHISNILNCPEAAITRRRALEVLRIGAHASITDRLKDLEDQAVKRLQEVMYDDELFTKSPFAVVDRGLQLLKGVGRLKGTEDGKAPANRILILDAESSKMLKEGLAASKEAHRLNPPEAFEEIVIEKKDGTHDRR